MKWQPWIDFKKDADSDIPEIKEPPCKTCTFFRPQRRYLHDGSFDGVQLCHKPGGPERDFSCYKNELEK